MREILRKPTRKVKIGSIFIGDNSPIAVQSMTSTKTQNFDETLFQINSLNEAGADIIRIAVDSKEDAYSLIKLRDNVDANLSVDLQENYRLAEIVAPYVDKIRYNPGHLYHHEREKPWQEKVKYIASVAADNDCAIRIGVNCGSVDPEIKKKYPNVEWKKISGFRDILIHEYFGIDLKIVWDILCNKLPGLKGSIEIIYKDLKK